MFKPGQTVAFNGSTYQAFQTNVGGGSPYYDTNAVVFACEANRLLLFSEARFQFQEMRGGRPGNLFGTAELATLEEPWAGHSTRDLLAQAELDVFAAGNSYWIRDDDGVHLVRLDPSKMKVATSGTYDPVSGVQIADRLVAYAYVREYGATPVWYTPDEVAHYKPYPDTTNRFIGRSWVSSCITDVDSDAAFTEHKRNAVRNGANLGYVAVLDPSISRDDFDYFVERFREDHERPENAGRTLFLGGGADVKTVGQTFENLAFKAVQGAGETRVAACSGVPPVIVGLSEGLSSATYSNYSQARRRLVDGTMRPLWGFFAAAMQSIIPVPGGARLWYDDRDIPFLREDVQEQAQTLQQNAAAIITLINGGFEPDAVVDAVNANDLGRLGGKHTGLVSVQLQPPGAALPGTPAAQDQAAALPPPNGNAEGAQPTAGAAAKPPATASDGTSRRARRTRTREERAQAVRRIEAARRGLAVVTRYGENGDGRSTGVADDDHEREPGEADDVDSPGSVDEV